MSNLLNNIPLNGVKSCCQTNNGLLLGDASNGNIYLLNGNNLSIFSKTGETQSVNNIISIDGENYFASMGGKLNIVFSNAYSIASNSSTFSNTVSIGNTATVLDLGDEIIMNMIEIPDTENIILSTSNGRILACNKSIANAYLTGEVTIYADARNGLGISNSASTEFMYALYKKIAEVNEDKEIEKWKFACNAVAIANEQVIGEFIGPILQVKEDLGFWKQIAWTETKPIGTDIVISLRSGNSVEDLLNEDWDLALVSKSGETNPIIRNLEVGSNASAISGQYLQLKVKMITSANNITPIVANVSIKYSTKQASYFYTTKFSFEKNSNPNNGLLVANITEPLNTEVSIGVTSKNSNNWSDYQVVNPNELFTLTDQNMQNIKVGIKFVTYSTNIPEVAEFALFIGGEKVKVLTN